MAPRIGTMLSHQALAREFRMTMSPFAHMCESVCERGAPCGETISCNRAETPCFGRDGTPDTFLERITMPAFAAVSINQAGPYHVIVGVVTEVCRTSVTAVVFESWDFTATGSNALCSEP
jgi:hypothetical protein